MIDARLSTPATSHAHGVAAMCAADCASGRSGHGLLAIQERVAAASPGAWRDAIVTGLGADGRIEVVDLDRGALALWHHAAAELELGEPVSIHPVAGVLAAGRRLLSVHTL